MKQKLSKYKTKESYH